MMIGGVRITNPNYWTLKQFVTTNNDDNLNQVTHSKDNCNYKTHKIFSVFTSHCLVAALFIQPRHKPCVSLLWETFTDLFPRNGYCTVACLHSCYLAMGLHVRVSKNVSDRSSVLIWRIFSSYVYEQNCSYKFVPLLNWPNLYYHCDV
jgi:hypothetical protein